MVKHVVTPVSVGYGCYQEIENPTPQKFFFCRYYTIHQHNSQAPSLNTQNLHRSSQRKRPTKKARIYFRKSAGLPLSSVVCCCANRRCRWITNNQRGLTNLSALKNCVAESKEIFIVFQAEALPKCHLFL